MENTENGKWEKPNPIARVTEIDAFLSNKGWELG
jgi:hypothetical protein